VEAVPRLIFEERQDSILKSTVGLFPRIVTAVERLPVLVSPDKRFELFRLKVGLHVYARIPLSGTLQTSVFDYRLLPVINIPDSVYKLRIFKGMV
jgi:hypothetical protein